MYTKHFFSFLLLVCFAQCFREHVEHYQPVPLARGWTVVAVPPSDHILKLTFALKIKNRHDLEELFWDVSNPDSPNYAKYLDLNTIIKNYAPDTETLGVLYKWLSSFGITTFKTTPTRDFVTVDMSVKTAQEMFQVQFLQYSHPEHGIVTRSLDPYTLPSSIKNIVSFVTGINRFPSRGSIKPITTSKRAVSQNGVTPQVIWSTFVTNGEKGKAETNLQGVAQFLEQYYDPADLSDFEKHFQIDEQPAAKVIGPNNPSSPGTEALLDIEYIIGTAPNITTWFWSTAGLHDGQEPFVQWAQDMNSAATIPYVISVSYGDEESSVTKDYTDRLNDEFQKLALRGVSVLFASGDNGVGCLSKCVNDPNWPASSPYVTTVGGFYNPSSLTGDVISSGGFSNYYSLPSYQMDAVTNYLTNGPDLPPESQYNKSGRAMPDVSSFSRDVIVFQNGGEISVGGTSCASPVFAAVISLINDHLLQSQLKPLGFLNTALYKIGASTPNAFIDITKGNNAADCCKGFTATKGWDPITGWGGPNYPVLRQALMAFQEQKNNLI